ncbi:MAG: hypothetical protein Q9159_003706 [Coniocarpon cinnabarinum]
MRSKNARAGNAVTRAASRGTAKVKRSDEKTEVVVSVAPQRDSESPPPTLPSLEIVSLAPPMLDDILPVSKRLSPLPDFAQIHAEEVAKIMAMEPANNPVSEPWVRVRSVAEKSSSRRSSVFGPPSSPRSTTQKPIAARSTSSPKLHSTSAPSFGLSRARARSVSLEHSKSASAQENAVVGPATLAPQTDRPSHSTTSFCAQTDLQAGLHSKPRLVSQFSSLESTQSARPVRQSSPPSRKTSLKQRVRSRTTTGVPERKYSVEDAVRELEEIVHTKREGASLAADAERVIPRVRHNKKGSKTMHRPAIAPHMVMKEVSSSLLDEIGSGLSRPLFDESELSSMGRTPSDSTTSLPLSTVSKRRSSCRDSAALPDWRTGKADSVRHSGTFFFSRRSLDEIIAPKSAKRMVSPLRNGERNGDSPVDRHWSDQSDLAAQGRTPSRGDQVSQKPIPTRPPAAHNPLTSNPVQPPSRTPVRTSQRERSQSPSTYIPFHRRNLSTTSQSTLATVKSFSTDLLSLETKDKAQAPPAVPSIKKLPLPPSQASRSSARPASPITKNERPQSRADGSSAVLAARQRAASRVAEEEALGMGLGIGGMLSAQDLSHIVEMDVWNAKPAHQHPSRSRANSVVGHRTDSVLVEPSQSPMVAHDQDKDAVLQNALSVSVGKGHVAQLVRTKSGRAVNVVRKTGTDGGDNDISQQEDKDKAEADRPRPLAGAPRRPSKESNNQPGKPSAPSQNEARRRHGKASLQLPPQALRSRASKTNVKHTRSDTLTEHEYRGSAHLPVSPRPRSRTESVVSAHSGAEEFGLDLQRTASARALRESRSQLESRDKTVPPVPANVGSPVRSTFMIPTSSHAQGNVRASQVGMAF